ncbi:unnamed protein product, partial [Dicrocoelium dendriticum]
MVSFYEIHRYDWPYVIRCKWFSSSPLFLHVVVRRFASEYHVVFACYLSVNLLDRYMLYISCPHSFLPQTR